MGGARLDRVLSPVEVLLLTLSALSPVASVFIGGNAVLHMAGTGAAIGFIAGGVLAALFALLFAELASSFPGAGGTYPSLNAILGPRWTFPYVMLRLFFSFPIVAFFSVGLGAYLHTLVPTVPQQVITLAGLFSAGLVAALNVKRGSKVVATFLVIEAAALLILAAVASAHLSRPLDEVLFNPQQLFGGALRGTDPTLLALSVVAGASMCAGADWATFFAEEMDEAHRRIGRVIAWAGLIAAITIAVPVVLVVLAIDDLPAVLSAEAPMAAFLTRSAGPAVATIVSAGVVVAIFNALIAAVMGSSRQLFAIGRDGVLPGPVSRILSLLHGRMRSPSGATAVLLAIAAGFTILGERRLLTFTSGNFSEYVLMGAAIIVGRRLGRTGHHFRVPAHPAVPAISALTGLGVVVANWSDAEVARRSMAILSGIFIVAFVWHEVWIRLGKDPISLTGTDIED